MASVPPNAIIGLVPVLKRTLPYEDQFMVRCPFVLVHQVKNSRLRQHLEKCRRNYIKANDDKPIYLSCKWNYEHQILAPEIDFHEFDCPDQMKAFVDHLFTTEYEKIYKIVEPYLDNEKDKDGNKIQSVAASNTFAEVISDAEAERGTRVVFGRGRATPRPKRGLVDLVPEEFKPEIQDSYWKTKVVQEVIQMKPLKFSMNYRCPLDGNSSEYELHLLAMHLLKLMKEGRHLLPYPENFITTVNPHPVEVNVKTLNDSEDTEILSDIKRRRRRPKITEAYEFEAKQDSSFEDETDWRSKSGTYPMSNWMEHQQNILDRKLSVPFAFGLTMKELKAISNKDEPQKKALVTEQFVVASQESTCGLVKEDGEDEPDFY